MIAQKKDFSEAHYNHIIYILNSLCFKKSDPTSDMVDKIDLVGSNIFTNNLQIKIRSFKYFQGFHKFVMMSEDELKRNKYFFHSFSEYNVEDNIDYGTIYAWVLLYLPALKDQINMFYNHKNITKYNYNHWNKYEFDMTTFHNYPRVIQAANYQIPNQKYDMISN